MKEANMHRALILLEARANVAKLVEAADADFTDSYEQQRIMAVSVGDRTADGIDHAADVDLDVLTGRHLLIGLAKLIDDELEALGVTP